MSQTKAQLIDGKVATVEFSGGSASAPSIAFTGDTNTGIYSPGADQVAISTNGSGRLSIDSSGNINVLQENAGPSYPEQRLKWSNDSTTTNGFYISQGTDRNGKIWHEQGLDIQFATNNTERMRLDSSGRLGIGTSAPAQLLHVKSSSAYGVIVVDNNGATGGGLFSSYQNGAQKAAFGVSGSIEGNTTSDLGLFADSTGGAIRFYTNGLPVTKAILDSTGRLGIGTTAPTSNLHVEQNQAGNTQIFLNNTSTAAGSYSTFGITTGAVTGQIYTDAQGNDGLQGMTIRTTTNHALRFGTNNTERVRLDTSGRLLVGTSSALDRSAQITSKAASGNDGIYVQSISNSNLTICSHVNTTSGTRYHISFGDGTTFTERGNISTNGTGTTYTTTSDYRLKENLAPLSDAIERIKNLRPKRFNFIGDGSIVDGFIAHEVQKVVPEAVTGEKDAVADDGKPVYQGIDQSRIVPLLTAALQEAVAKIESLEARLTAAGI